MDPIEAVKAKYADQVLGTGTHAGQPWIDVKRDRIVDILKTLRDDVGLDMLTDLTAVDHLNQGLPERCAVDRRIRLGNPGLHPRADVVLHRVELVDDREAFRQSLVEVVDRRQVRQHVEADVVAEGLEDVDDTVALHVDPGLAGVRAGTEHLVGVFRLDGFDRVHSCEARGRYARCLIDSRSTFFWISMTASMTLSGRGGHPGMYTSTGMKRSIPWIMA